MAKKSSYSKSQSSNAMRPAITQEDAPKVLTEHPFYGLSLDEYQTDFRDAIWNPAYDMVCCNAKSGSGKTLIAVGTAMLMVEYGLADSIIYMMAAGVHEHKQGLLPGTLEEKSKYTYLPLIQALIKLGYDPDRLVCSEMNMVAQKEGTAKILALTDSYVRGINIGDEDNRVIFVCDEFQNYTREAARAVLSRNNNGKVILIGSDKQIDLKYAQDSAFPRVMSLYGADPRCKLCELKICHRGWISELADSI